MKLVAGKYAYLMLETWIYSRVLQMTFHSCPHFLEEGRSTADATVFVRVNSQKVVKSSNRPNTAPTSP